MGGHSGGEETDDGPGGCVKPSEVLRRVKERKAKGQFLLMEEVPDGEAYEFLVRADWDFDRAIALAEAKE